MAGESDKFETDASDAEETARPDVDPRTAADETAGDTEPVDPATDSETAGAEPRDGAGADADDMVPENVQKYARFEKVDGAQYDRVNDFLRERTYVTAREWAITQLCADLRTETGVEMTKIGNNLPELIPFMTDTYTPQAVSQARSAFRDGVRKSDVTFLYDTIPGFLTAGELDEMVYEVIEITKFLLEVEGVDPSAEEKFKAEERISSVVREVHEASTELRQEELSDGERRPTIRTTPRLRPRTDIAPTRSQGKSGSGSD